MIEFEKSIFINRSPQVVFDYIVDPAKYSLWQSSIQSAEWTSDSRGGVGSTQRVITKFLGRNIEAETQLTGWEPPHKVSFKSISGPIPIEITNKVEPQGDGTLVTTMGRAEFGGFFKLAEGLAGKQLDKQMDADLNSLKLLMESNQV